MPSSVANSPMSAAKSMWLLDVWIVMMPCGASFDR